MGTLLSRVCDIFTRYVLFHLYKFWYRNFGIVSSNTIVHSVHLILTSKCPQYDILVLEFSRAITSPSKIVMKSGLLFFRAA